MKLLFADRGGFEPPVQLPVRQFSKLVVSATHPSILSRWIYAQLRCKDTISTYIIKYLHNKNKTFFN